MTTNVRRATIADAEQIAEVISEVRSERDPTGLGDVQSADDVRAWIARQGDQGALFVLDDGRGRVLGFAAIDFDSSQPRECSFGAWVRARNRRQGHASQLATVALDFARERGYRRIRGRLPEHNEPALSFLSSIGALVPLTNPGATFELPIYEEGA